MNIEPAMPTTKNPPAQFAGDFRYPGRKDRITDDKYNGR